MIPVETEETECLDCRLSDIQVTSSMPNKVALWETKRESRENEEGQLALFVLCEGSEGGGRGRGYSLNRMMSQLRHTASAGLMFWWREEFHELV